jgi:hypothetical protein
MCWLALCPERAIAHETIVAGALERSQRLLEQFNKDEWLCCQGISVA